jgi:small subunit ribosomal protein S27Ae
MQIFLHRLDGSQAVLNIDSQTTLESILAQNTGKRLVYEGSILASLELLRENANVYITGDLDGGKKKKKKKAYTTKKKNKHIHKKVKLLPLSLYAVDGNNCLIQVKETLLNKEKPAHHVVLVLLWPNIGIVTTVDSATQPLRWMLKLLRRTNKK